MHEHAHSVSLNQAFALYFTSKTVSELKICILILILVISIYIQQFQFDGTCNSVVMVAIESGLVFEIFSLADDE